MPIIFDHSEEYYRTGLKEEALDYLNKLELFFDKKDLCESYWKWIIISLHGSIYHFMLLALRNTDGSGVWENEMRDEAGHIDFSREDEMYLVGFNNAFSWVKENKRMGGYVGSKSFVSTENIDNSMKKLNFWRNNFVHYKPKGWSIEIEIFREVVLGVLPVLKFIANDCIRVILDENERAEISRIIGKFEHQLSLQY